MSGGETILIIEANYIRKLRKAEAFDEKSAKTLAELKIRDNFIFRKLVKKGIFVAVEDGRFYIDDEQARSFQSVQKRMIFFVLLLGITLFVVLYFLGVIKPK